MNAYVWLGIAILAEVTGTISLKFAEGFTKSLPSILVVLGYGIAFFAMSQVLKAGLPIGIVYAVWAALGVALVALIGAIFLHEPFNLTIAAGLILVIGGVVLLETGSTTA